MDTYPHDEKIRLANELYVAVIDMTPNPTSHLANVIDLAAQMYALPLDDATLTQLRYTLHDYALMLAADLNSNFDCNPLLKHPAPHDDIISFLEESGLLTD